MVSLIVRTGVVSNLMETMKEKSILLLFVNGEATLRL